MLDSQLAVASDSPAPGFSVSVTGGGVTSPGPGESGESRRDYVNSNMDIYGYINNIYT